MRRTPDNAANLDRQAARTVTTEIDTDRAGSLIMEAASPTRGARSAGATAG
jgi:hypothetical protein